jgi:IclR family transcriptional regulator, KDG regulon repressor
MLNTSEPNTPGYEVGAVRKALEILCQFSAAHPAHSVSDLGRLLEMPKSTTYNLLRTLERYDFLRQDPADRRYRLGPRVFELGLLYSHKSSLVSVAYPYMRKLAEETRETVKLGVPSNGELLIVAAIESPFQLHTRGDEGVRAPLHCTGLGKAILSTFVDEDVTEIIEARGLRPLTPNTITDMDRLLVELAGTRIRGYTLDIEENEVGVVCAAAPVADSPHGMVAALSVSAPASRMDMTQLKACADVVVRTSRAISTSLRGSSMRRMPSHSK